MFQKFVQKKFVCVFRSREKGSTNWVSMKIAGTKIIADLEKCFEELISEKLQILLWDRPCLELIIVSSKFQALLFLQDKLLESV